MKWNYSLHRFSLAAVGAMVVSAAGMISGPAWAADSSSAGAPPPTMVQQAVTGVATVEIDRSNHAPDIVERPIGQLSHRHSRAWSTQPRTASRRRSGGGHLSGGSCCPGRASREQCLPPHRVKPARSGPRVASCPRVRPIQWFVRLFAWTRWIMLTIRLRLRGRMALPIRFWCAGRRCKSLPVS